MSFGGLGCIPPTGVIAGPVNALTFKYEKTLPESLTFAKPFPVASQQWSAFQPLGKISSTYPQGWRPWGLDYAFKPPFPVWEQPFISGSGKGSVPTWF